MEAKDCDIQCNGRVAVEILAIGQSAARMGLIRTS